jgi:hypothetical protein
VPNQTTAKILVLYISCKTLWISVAQVDGCEVLKLKLSIISYVSPGILVLESLAAGSHDRLPTPLERDLADA